MAQLDRVKRITPTAPDRDVGGLLALLSAQVRPLASGDAWTGGGEAGCYALIAAVRGSLTVSSHSQYALANQGQAVALAAVEPYTVQAVGDCLSMAVRLRGLAPERLLERSLAGGGTLLFHSGAAAVREAVLALSVLEDQLGSVPGGAASACGYTLLTRLWESGRRVPEPDAALVEAATAIIQEEFAFLEGLDELAERLEVSKGHLSRVFVRKTGVSPGKYITRVRLEYARLLLREPGASISYAAEASGFSNANYFAKVFRRETGMTPSAYLASAPREPRSSHLL